MIVVDERAQVGRAHVILLVTQGVVQIELIDTELVGHGHVGVVGNPLGNPVVAADGFQPPDFVQIAEGDAVHLIGAELFQKGTKTLHALTGGTNVRQDDGDQVLLADAAGHLRQVTVLTGLAQGRCQLHQGVGTQNTLIGGDGLGGGHGHVGGVDTRLGPESLIQYGIGHRGIAHGVVGQVHLHMAQDAAVVAGLLVRFHHDEPLRAELPVGRILIAGDDGGPVVAGVFANQQRGAGHETVPPFLRMYQNPDEGPIHCR